MPEKQAGDHFYLINEKVYYDFVEPVLIQIPVQQLQNRYQQGYISVAFSELRSLYYPSKRSKGKTSSRVDRRNEDAINFRLVISKSHD